MEEQMQIDDVKACLQGAPFPCSKTDLVDYCQQHAGSPVVIETLRSTQDETYTTLDQVIENIEAKPTEMDDPFVYYDVWAGYRYGPY